MAARVTNPSPSRPHDDSARTVNEGHSDVNREVARMRDWRTFQRHYPHASRCARNAFSSAIMSGQSPARKVIVASPTG